VLEQVTAQIMDYRLPQLGSEPLSEMKTYQGEQDEREKAGNISHGSVDIMFHYRPVYDYSDTPGYDRELNSPHDHKSEKNVPFHGIRFGIGENAQENTIVQRLHVILVTLLVLFFYEGNRRLLFIFIHGSSYIFLFRGSL
jgi:hypothetical protein